MKKSTLKDSISDYYQNILIYAISSTESDLRLCMLLNQALNINLALAPNSIISTKKGEQSFRRYSYEFDEGIEKINFYLNRDKGNILIPELKTIDYILVFQSEANTSMVEAKLQELKSTPDFSVISKVDPSSLKSLSRIIAY